jgi:hypothetical protein
MADLIDSGSRREFETGSVRDVAEGKGRCDLLPLGVIAERLHDDTLMHIENYIRGGKTNYLWLAVESFYDKCGWNAYTSLLETAKQYEDGAKKYEPRNWEKGQPLHVYIDSAVRHYLKYMRGDKDEPHDRAFLWNMLCAIWTHENKPELIDLPFATAKE